MTRLERRGAAARPPAQLLRLNRHSLASILVVGGTGTQREAIARIFHRHSPRRAHPFRALDCRYDARMLEHALECWLVPSALPAVSNPLEGAGGGMLFMDRLEYLSEATQHRLLVLSRLLGSEAEAVARRLPGRLAAGSRWYVPSIYGRPVVPELLDALDKIRVNVDEDVAVTP